MGEIRVCVLALVLMAAATNGHPQDTPPNTEAPHEGNKVPHEPRGQPPHQALPHPPHDAAVDKSAQPILPRDSSIVDIHCSIDYNCTSSVMGENSICHGSICACTTGAFQSSTSNRCLKESHLGGGCAEDLQCTRPLGDTVSCKNFICTCIPNSENINGKCWRKKPLGDTCEANEECFGGRNAVCTDHRCICKPNMTPAPSNDKCLSVATKYSDPCEEDIQCTEPFTSGAACTNGKCVCKDGYHYKNHICMKNLKLDSPCGGDIEGGCFLLHDQGINHVDCIDNKCQCQGTRVASSDGEKCLDPDQKDPGSGGGAESIQPLLLTFFTMFLAIFLLY